MANLQQLRSLYPDARSDEDVISRASKQFGIDATEIANEVGYDAGDGGLTSKRLGGSVDSYQSNLYGVGGAVARKLGMRGVASWMDEGRDDNEVQADVAAGRAKLLGGVDNWRDIDGVASGANFLGGLAAQSAPYLAESLVGGVAARGLMLGTKAALRGAETVQAATKARNTLNAGSMAGATAASYPSAVGDILSNQRDENGGEDLGSAAAGGVLYAGLNAVGVEGLLARGVRPVNLLRGGTLAKVGKEAGVTALTEGSSETGQELVNQGFGRMAVNPNQTLFNQEANERYLDSFVGGAALGGVFGGAGGLRGPERTAQPLDETQERNLLDPTPPQRLGFNPLAGSPIVFPDGTVTLNSEQELGARYPNSAGVGGEAPGVNVPETLYGVPGGGVIADPLNQNMLNADFSEDPGAELARQQWLTQRSEAAAKAEAQQQQAQELQAEAQRQQAEKARIESFGVTAKGDNHKLYQELEALRDEGTITPAQFTENAAKIVGETPVDRNGARKFVRDVVKAQQPKVSKPPSAAEVATANDTPPPVDAMAATLAKLQSDAAPKVAAVTPEGKRTFQVKPAAPVAPVAPKEDFRTRYRAANTEISALRAERKKLVVPKDATGNAIKGGEAELGDFGDVDAASPQGKRIAEIDNRIRAVLPPVADIRAQVENVLSMRDQTSDGKSRPRDPVLQRRLSAVTGIVMGENGLEQPATPLTMAEVARQEGVTKQAISQQLQKHGLSDMHISRLVANELEAPTDTTANAIDENDATSDSASDQVTEESIDDTSMRVSSSAARATGDGIVGVGGADMTPEQKQAEAAGTRMVKSLGKEAESAPTPQDLAFEVKRKEVAKATLMRELAAWVQTGNGRLLGQWWNDRALMANHPMFEDLPTDAQVNWAQATFKLTSEENTDAQFDAIYAEQSKGLPTDEPEVRDASGPANASGDGTPAETGGGRRDAPAPTIVTKKPRVVRDAQGRKITAEPVSATPVQVETSQGTLTIADPAAALKKLDTRIDNLKALLACLS